MFKLLQILSGDRILGNSYLQRSVSDLSIHAFSLHLPTDLIILLSILSSSSLALWIFYNLGRHNHRFKLSFAYSSYPPYYHSEHSIPSSTPSIHNSRILPVFLPLPATESTTLFRFLLTLSSVLAPLIRVMMF